MGRQSRLPAERLSVDNRNLRDNLVFLPELLEVALSAVVVELILSRVVAAPDLLNLNDIKTCVKQAS